MADDSTPPAQGPVGRIRTLATSLLSSRFGLFHRMGIGDTFFGERNLDEAFGYKPALGPLDYRHRYDRGGIAGRIVDAYPTATWRGEGEVVEDENPDHVTPFEQAFYDMTDRLHVWAALRRADVLSQLGHYSILLLGAPGALETPLEPGNPEDLAYLTPISEAQAQIQERDLEVDTASPRFGHPMFYRVTNLGIASQYQLVTQTPRMIHWTRVIHLADGLLDLALYAQPRLMRVWNLIDNLDKVTGGGAEAFFRRAHRGLNLNLDKDVMLGPDEKVEIDRQIDEFEHTMRRNLRTRGVTVTELGSDVADFEAPADAILTQIAGATGIPKRILVGSEAGQLASSQDRSNWRDQITDRRYNYAGPFVARQFIDRCIEFGFLPEPTAYDVRWPAIQFLDETERAAVATQWATINSLYAPLGQTAIEPNEIRDRLLGLPPLTTLHTASGSVTTPSLKRAAARRHTRTLRRRPTGRLLLPMRVAR